MFSRVDSKNRVLFIHLFTVKLLMKLLRSTQHYRQWKKWVFILAFLLKQVCSQTEKSVVPCAFCWALRRLPFWFSFSLFVWDYRRLALIVLKLRADSVKGKTSLLNCSHCSGFFSLLLLQGCRHPTPAPAAILPSQADSEERDKIDHSRIDRR